MLKFVVVLQGDYACRCLHHAIIYHHCYFPGIVFAIHVVIPVLRKKSKWSFKTGGKFKQVVNVTLCMVAYLPYENKTL